MRMLPKIGRWLAYALVIVGLVAAPAAAQTTGATLQGVVTDEQGGVLPGVSVAIVNVDTGWTRALTSDERGWYRATALPPGPYEIRAEISGFVRQVRSGLSLTIGQEATVNLTLKLATVEETVTVMAETPLVEMTKSAIGTTVTRAQLDSLPLAGRNFAALAQTAPGVTGVGGGGVNAGGQLSRNNSFLIDGASNDDNVVAGTRGGFSLEAVREFVVLASQFAAEYGQASGAIVSVITRSGTNQAQGRGFIFHRDDRFDARNPFSKAQGSGQAPFSEQRFGSFLGGPILRDRVHYFGAYEGLRQAETSVITSQLVPPNEREHPHKQKGHQYFLKIDYRLPRSHALAVRYRLDRDDEIAGNIGDLNTRERGFDVERRDQDAVANLTTILSARALNEFRYQFARRFLEWHPEDYSPPGSPAVIRPQGNFGKAGNMPQGRREERHQFINNVSYTLGPHDLKTGFDISLIRVRSFFFNNVDGTFTFQTNAPFNPNDLSTYPSQFTQNVGSPYLKRVNNLYGFFVQDSWRYRPNLTFNLGLRYDSETAFRNAAGVADDRNNVAPRLGFVWDPFKDGRTAFRGGYGLYYDQAFLNITGNIMLARRFVGVTIRDPGFPDPYSRGSAAPPSRPSTELASPDIETPSTRQLSLGVKRELRAGLAVSIDVVNSRGYHLFNRRDLNYPDAITRVRPNPDFLRIAQYETTGSSWYNGLLLGVERRSGKGPFFGISYTFSSQLRDVEDFGSEAQNQFNRGAEKALANNHRKHQVVANLTWPLPAGFQVGAVLQARSGLPWNVRTGSDNNRDTVFNDRPDLANPSGDRTDPNTYFAGFTGRVGNLGRNANIGPGFFVVDARISKIVRVSRLRLEGFVEAFNLFNRANLGLPLGNLSAGASFGRPSALAASATPRQVELGFRVDF